MTRTNPSPHLIRHALIVAAVYIGLAATIKYLTPAYVSPELSHRLHNIMAGVLAVIYANAASKTLTPLSTMRCDPITEQAMRRFSAWTLTLGALGYTLAWLILPLESAHVVAVSLLAGSILIVGARYVTVITRGLRT